MDLSWHNTKRYKALNGLGPRYLAEHLLPTSSASHSFQPGWAAEGRNTKGGLEGKNEELGLPSSGSSPLEQLAHGDLPGSLSGYL